MIDSNPKYLDRVVCDFEHCIKPRYGQRFKANGGSEKLLHQKQ